MIDYRLAITAVLSVLLHLALARGLEHLPAQGATVLPPPKVEVKVVEPPKADPPPEPPKPEEPKPELPKPKDIPHEIPKVKPQTPAPQVATAAKNTPPPEHPAVQAETTDEPVYGWNMESTSPAGKGPALPIGNTPKADPGKPTAPGPVKPLAEPVAAAEATKLPIPQGRCFGKYTDDARAAGVEGTVVLDVIVGEDGSVRDVVVTQGLPHGLSEAAIAALRGCKFTPGERDGKPVPVKVRGFKIHFVLAEAQ